MLGTDEPEGRGIDFGGRRAHAASVVRIGSGRARTRVRWCRQIAGASTVHTLIQLVVDHPIGSAGAFLFAMFILDGLLGTMVVRLSRRRPFRD